MFKESTVIVKVPTANQAIDSTEVPIASVVKMRVPSVFLFSRSGTRIKTKLHVKTNLT